jgi:hypothetical protein
MNVVYPLAPGWSLKGQGAPEPIVVALERDDTGWWFVYVTAAGDPGRVKQRQGLSLARQGGS